MDKIVIKNLRLRGIIGIKPDERVNPQEILVNVVAFADIRPAAASADIADAVNYAAMSARIRQHVADTAELLVETLVTDIARLLLAEFNISRVQVRVEKPEALTGADSVGIEIERTPADFDLPQR